MNHIKVAMPTLIARSFMLAPHLNAGAGGAGAAAEELADTLTEVRRAANGAIETLLVAMVHILDSNRGEEAARTDAPTSLHEAGIAILVLLREKVAILLDFMVNAMVACLELQVTQVSKCARCNSRANQGCGGRV